MTVLNIEHLQMLCYLENTAIEYSKASATKRKLMLDLRDAKLIIPDEDGFMQVSVIGDNVLTSVVESFNTIIEAST